MTVASPNFQQSSPPPRHVAVIMDGNGRWAQGRGLPRTAGHKMGAERVREVVRAAGEIGVSYLTLFGFSSENWNRPASEVTDLMGLLRLYLRREVKELDKNNVRLTVIGDRARLSPDIAKLIDDAEARTKDNAGLKLIIALSYGGREELVNAVRAIAERVENKTLSPHEIDETTLGEHLYAPDVPDPDLLIRTSGEQRISNFLLWQLAYTEMVFVDTLWPDFGREAFVSAVQSYHGRDRRFGGTRG